MSNTTKVSPTCEYIERWGVPPTYCGKPTAWWYPAMGGGTMALCAEHGVKHEKYARRYKAAVRTESE